MKGRTKMSRWVVKTKGFFFASQINALKLCWIHCESKILEILRKRFARFSSWTSTFDWHQIVLLTQLILKKKLNRSSGLIQSNCWSNKDYMLWKKKRKEKMVLSAKVKKVASSFQHSWSKGATLQERNLFLKIAKYQNTKITKFS